MASLSAPGLKELTLSANPGVTSKGWGRLAIAVAHSSQLRVLNLDYNPLGKQGTKGYCVPTCPRLCCLLWWVAGNPAVDGQQSITSRTGQLVALSCLAPSKLTLPGAHSSREASPADQCNVAVSPAEGAERS